MEWNILLKGYKDIYSNLNFADTEDIRQEEIGDGNLNDVFRLYSVGDDGSVKQSVVIKHSLPYIKCIGETFPLTEDRIEVEYNALVQFHAISPGSVPEPYLLDTKNNAVCMEDLQGYTVLRTKLMEGEFHMETAESISKHIANIHHKTHIGTVGEEKLKHMQDTDFKHSSHMVNLTKNFVFTHPFEGDGTNRCSDAVKEKLDTIYGSPEVLETAKKMRKIFLEKKECLVHGDLHTGSILVKGTNARMFDVEFAYVGPAAFDIGTLIANYIFSYYRHMSIEENNDEHRRFAYSMVDACKVTVETYLSHMTASVGDRASYVENLVSEMAGFAGCEIVRRLVGVAHNADLEGMPLAEVDCLAAGVRLLSSTDKIHDIDRLLFIGLMLC